MTEADSQYLELWRRMRRVVDAYTSYGRASEADYCMADFFMCFSDVEELERHVAIAEQTAQDEKVVAGES